MSIACNGILLQFLNKFSIGIQKKGKNPLKYGTILRMAFTTTIPIFSLNQRNFALQICSTGVLYELNNHYFPQ